MQESVEFQLLNLTLLDEKFPAGLKDLNLTENEVMWNYSFSFGISPFPNDKKSIKTDLSYSLFLKNDPEKKPILLIQTYNLFSVTAKMSAGAKLKMVNNVLHIACWNLQGIYAVKTEGSSLSHIMPTQYNLRNHEEHFKKVIADEWE